MKLYEVSFVRPYPPVDALDMPIQYENDPCSDEKNSGRKCFIIEFSIKVNIKEKMENGVAVEDSLEKSLAFIQGMFNLLIVVNLVRVEVVSFKVRIVPKSVHP